MLHFVFICQNLLRISEQSTCTDRHHIFLKGTHLEQRETIIRGLKPTFLGLFGGCRTRVLQPGKGNSTRMFSCLLWGYRCLNWNLDAIT